MSVAKISKIKLPSGTVYQLNDNSKAPLDSAALIGTPTAPTPAAGDSSNRIATTAFVMAMMKPVIRITIINGTGGPAPNYTGISATATTTLASGESYSYTGTANDAGIILIPTEYSGCNYTLTYSDTRIKGDKNVFVRSSGYIEVGVRYEETVKYTVRIDEAAQDTGGQALIYMDDAAGRETGSAWDNQPIFNAIRPCVLKNGIVQCYLKKDDFTKRENNNETVDLTCPDGSDIMIEIPKFGYRIRREFYGTDPNDPNYSKQTYLYVEITNQDDAVDEYGAYCYDAFSRVQNGDLGKFYQGAYKGFIDGSGNLRSIAGAIPTHGGVDKTNTIGGFRTAAQRRNNNTDCHYQQATYAHLVALQCLYLIKYRNRNGQTAIGRGICDFASAGVDGTGSNSSLTFVTGYDLASIDNVGVSNGTQIPTYSNADAATKAAASTAALGMDWAGRTNGKSHMKLFGIEDFWGNIYEWVDGLWTQIETVTTTNENEETITTKKVIYYSSWNTYIDNNNSGEGATPSYTATFSGFTSATSGYITEVVGDSQFGFMPTKFGGAETKYWADVGIVALSSCVLYFGGGWNYAGNAGPFCLYVNAGAGAATRNIGGRLSYN